MHGGARTRVQIHDRITKGFATRGLQMSIASVKEKIMEPALIMKTASCLLAIAALGGLTMAGIRFSGKPQPPAWLAMLHGFLAAAAVTLLLYAYFTVGLPVLACWALLLFLIAAVGGAFLNLNYHWKIRPLPMALIVGHAGVAVIGFALLLAATWAATRA
jgi:hypothetical protein